MKSIPHDAQTLIDRAVAVFAHGFSFTRSFTHPYHAERVGPLWVLRDAPRKGGDYRSEEWIAHNILPTQIHQIARDHTRGRFAICAIHPAGQPDTTMRTEFKSRGYRLGRTEPVMIHRLDRIPRIQSPATIRRVRTQALADTLNTAARSRQILPEHLSTDVPLRQYVAMIDNAIVGWVRSITVDDATWCSNMFVMPRFRRQGIGRALLGRMLRDDRSHGTTLSVLTASHTGVKLYETVGYDQIATLYLYTPGK